MSNAARSGHAVTATPRHCVHVLYQCRVTAVEAVKNACSLKQYGHFKNALKWRVKRFDGILVTSKDQKLPTEQRFLLWTACAPVVEGPEQVQLARPVGQRGLFTNALECLNEFSFLFEREYNFLFLLKENASIQVRKRIGSAEVCVAIYAFSKA